MDGLQVGRKVLVMLLGIFVGAALMAAVNVIIGFSYQVPLWVASVHNMCVMLYGYFAIRLVVETVKDLK